MSVYPKTRVAVANRWISAALAVFLLGSASLLAQSEQEKKKEPPPAHQKSGKTEEHAGRPANAPATPPVRPNTPPVQAERPQRPVNSGGTPVTPATNDTGRRFGNGNPNATQNANPANNDNGRRFGNGSANPNANRVPSGTVRNAPEPANVSRPAYHGANGSEVRYRSNGQPQVVQARGMTITHSPSGVRRVEYARPDRSIVVSQGSRHGYVQRPYVVNNVNYVQRTYVVGGRSFARVYRPYTYRGFSLNIYVSSRYYAPAYYGWAYSPWSTPVVYSWGWNASPWYGYYGGYFRPYPSYASAAFWLTDFMLAATLQEAYQERMDAAAVPPSDGMYANSQTELTPDVKQAISDEVRRQLDQERAESQSMSGGQGGPQFLADNSTHVFVVGNGLDVQSRSGECSLTEGDVLQMMATPPADSATAELAVLASKGMDCRKGTVVSVAIPDLQDMQNHMRETLDQGLADLQSRQGQGGIPSAPQAAQRPPSDAPYAAAAPPPDPNVGTEISQQAQQATQAETDVLNQAQSAPAGGAPASVTLGMTIDEVVGLLGQPQVVGDLGSKKTYFYGNMKVVFTDGKVSDIQ